MNRWCVRLLGAFPAVPVIFGAFTFCWGQGYTVQTDKVVMDTEDHWNHWSFPIDIADITPEGTIAPRYIRKGVNAVLSATEFVYDKTKQGGIREVGSNAREAQNIMDEDPSTFWEPDGDDPLDKWYVQIDLGRLVSADRIVLRFVEEGEGDPFYQFKVLVSNGEELFPGSGELMNFRVVGKTKISNRDRRIFEFEVSPQDRYAPGWTGGTVHYVQIVVTDSRLGKAEEVGKDVYDALTEADKGVVEYYRRTPSGEEILATEEEYEAFAPELQGPIRHYRRERPRLAEVEVWEIGDNISLGVVERGGEARATGVSLASAALDGRYTTQWLAMVYSPYRDRGILTVDLGATFWVDTYRVVTYSIWMEPYPLEGYVVRGSDGSRAPDGSLIWEKISPKEREHNPKQYLRFQDAFSSRKLRLIEFKNIDITGRRSGAYAAFAHLRELQVYGEGYVPEVILTSDLVELGNVRNLTTIEWDGEQPPDTKMEIRTRTGDDLMEVARYFDKGGREITERKYSSLPGFQKGDIVSEFVPGPGWSGWSSIYLSSGSPILSPSPRKYLMIQVRFLSDDPEIVPSLDAIRVHFVPPVASQVIGEISPDRGVLAGQPEEFAVFIRPTLMPGNTGIDEILVLSPAGVTMEMAGLDVGGEDDFLGNTTNAFTQDEEGMFVDASGRSLKILSDGLDSLWVRLPEVVRTGGPDLLRLRFRSTLFLNGTLFRVFVGNSSISGSWQRVDSEDATFLTSSKTLSVGVPVDEWILKEVALTPNPFTPNGDGINDVLNISFDVLKVNVSRAVRVGIYTLSAVRTREFVEHRTNASGRYKMAWDGRDEDGRAVPPGMYLCRIDVDVDSNSAENGTVTRVVYVVY